MEQKHMFTNKMIADLLIPVVLEQLDVYKRQEQNV